MINLEKMMHEEKQKEDAKKLNLYEIIIKKITSNPFKIGRPKELPPNATDCGYNHGEPKEE
jgi:hypothetical protein